MTRPLAATLLLIALSSLGLSAMGCASNGLDIPYSPVLAKPATAWQIEVSDARRFTNANDMAPVPSTEHAPIEAAWTQRVFGREMIGTDLLGADVFTAPGQSVPELVRLALVAGLESGGLTPPAASAGPLQATIEAFWIWREEFSATAKLNYIAHVRLQGPAHGLEHGLYLETRGSVSGGEFSGMLWEQAMKRVLEKVEQEAAKAVRAASGATHSSGS
jgi:hypothetical protein